MVRLFSGTPNTCAPAPAGLVRGPSILNTVTDAYFFARSGGIFHCRVKNRRQHEADAHRFQTFLYLGGFRSILTPNASSTSAAAALTAHSSVTVLGHL